MKIFYHLDNDGKCAGFWVKQLAQHTDNYDMEFYKMNYGMEFPFDSIYPDEQVFIVDYSISTEEMDRLLGITKNVTWIDHHASAIRRYENYDKEIRGIRYDGVAGCSLTYCYLKFMTDGGIGKEEKFDVAMLNQVPLFTKIIADYDIWAFKYGNDTRAFEKGFQLYDNEPYDETWERFLDSHKAEFFTGIINSGYTILMYREMMMREYCTSKGFETMFEGYTCFAVNMGMISSDDFKSVDVDQYDMLIGFSYDGKSWNYSLRSTKVDCSQVAMKYGGGGHPGAAGFNSDKLLLKAINDTEGM